jgi:hypothetical protein
MVLSSAAWTWGAKPVAAADATAKPVVLFKNPLRDVSFPWLLSAIEVLLLI